MRELHCGTQQLTLAEFKAMLRDQGFLLLLDPEAAVAALPVDIPYSEFAPLELSPRCAR